MSAARSGFDVNAFLSGSPALRFSVRIVIVCGALAAIEGMDQYIVATTLPALANMFMTVPAEFATVFVLQALGLVIGTYLIAPLADRVGRRPVILVSTLTFGLLTTLCAFAGTLPKFAAMRFVSFIFIGGALPNLFAIAGEFAAARNRQRYILLLGCVHGLGAGSAGLVGTRLLAFGWQAPLLFCGAVTLLTVVVAFLCLPESVRFLALHAERAGQLRELLLRIDPALDLASTDRYELHEAAGARGSIASLFSEGRSLMTAQLWIVAAVCLPVLGTVGQWMPTYFHLYAGYTLNKAALVNSASAVTAALWPFVLMLLMGRLGIARAMALSYLLAFFSLLTFAVIGAFPAIAWAVALGFGAFAAGSVSGFYALCAHAYPTSIRSTGMGWAIGAGRIVSIAAPALGGLALSRHASALSVATVVAAPMLVASLCALFVKLPDESLQRVGRASY
jgi:MFS family permease